MAAMATVHDAVSRDLRGRKKRRIVAVAASREQARLTLEFLKRAARGEASEGSTTRASPTTEGARRTEHRIGQSGRCCPHAVTVRALHTPQWDRGANVSL
jgi:hypothetical protein